MDETSLLAMRKGGLCDETLDERQKALGSEERLYPMPYHVIRNDAQQWNSDNVLPSLALHYTALHYTALHYTALHYTALHYTALHYTALHYTELHYTALHYTALHYTALHLAK